MNVSPIVLFVYNRPDHTHQTIQALQKNELAVESELFIYSDAAKNVQAQKNVQAVRRYIKNIDGFKKITVIERDKNWGLANSIIDGVTSIVNQYGKVIVLEDDLVTASYFLKYMNEALEKFEHDDRIISIHGYVYPVEQTLPKAFFLPGADCWGWSTWKRGWDLFNPDGKYLLAQLKEKNLIRNFDYNGSSPYLKMLEDQINGDNDSWAIRWYASAFLAEKLTLYPGKSLVHNIGNDDSGTHCSSNCIYDAQLNKKPIDISNLEVVANYLAREAFENFFRKQKITILQKVYRKLKSIFTKLF